MGRNDILKNVSLLPFAQLLMMDRVILYSLDLSNL
jgi:hypothetical protein